MKEFAGVIGYIILVLFTIVLHALPIVLLVYLMYLDIAARIAIGLGWYCLH